MEKYIIEHLLICRSEISDKGKIQVADEEWTILNYEDVTCSICVDINHPSGFESVDKINRIINLDTTK